MARFIRTKEIDKFGDFFRRSRLALNPAVEEAGVIGKPNPIRGKIIKAFMTLKSGYQRPDKWIDEIRLHVKQNLAAHAYPREIEVVNNLPKTKYQAKS